MKKIIETYKVIADFVPATVTIMDITEENVPIYEVTMPEFDVGTKALLGKIMEDLARVIPVSVEETTDPKKMDELKTRFFDAAKKEISKKFPRMTSESINIFSGVLLHNMYGLGDIEIILADLLLEEIVINFVSMKSFTFFASGFVPFARIFLTISCSVSRPIDL